MYVHTTGGLFPSHREPFTRLIEEKQSFQSFPKVEAVSQSLKIVLDATTVPEYPQPGEKSFVDVDISNIGIGEVLSQVQDGQGCIIIADCSKTLNKAEINCSLTHSELLLIMRTMKHFHKHLWGTTHC
jgi:hypothetical protein